MIQNPTIPTLAEPRLIDAVLLELQTAFASGLSWLNNAYGKAQRLVKAVEGKTYYYPSVYAGSTEYLTVFPDEHLLNHCFFDVEDVEGFNNWQKNGYSQLTAKVGIVFWFDYRDVYPADWQSRTIENVKRDVLRIITTTRLENQARFTPENFYEQAENIYKGYTHKEIQTQFLMRPYGGFKIEGTLLFNEKCP